MFPRKLQHLVGLEGRGVTVMRYRFFLFIGLTLRAMTVSLRGLRISAGFVVGTVWEMVFLSIIPTLESTNRFAYKFVPTVRK
jgi:hypothetical protein